MTRILTKNFGRQNTFNTVLGKVYENVSFPFTKDDVFKNTNDTNDKEAKAEYWYYDSSKSSLYLKQDKGNSKYYLSTKDSSGNLTTDGKSENREYDNDTNGTCGFFPFNASVGTGGASQYNYGFGAKLQFDFTLTDDGKVQVGNDASDKVPIKFFFSGDDDVWVYIDGQLVLDVGGAHGKASGLLEFGDNGKANTVTPYVSSNKQAVMFTRITRIVVMSNLSTSTASKSHSTRRAIFLIRTAVLSPSTKAPPIP